MKKRNFKDIIFNPQTDLELKYRDSLMEMTNYYAELEESTVCGLTKYINIENSLLEEYTVNLITTFKETKSIENVRFLIDTYTRTDPKVAARLIYESIVVFNQNKELTFEHIAKKCGYDFYDDEDKKEFIKNYIAVKEIENMGGDTKTEEDLKFYLDIVDNFKKIYANGFRKQHDSEYRKYLN